MPPRAEPFQLHRHAAAAAALLVDALADVYEDARAEPPYNSDPRWGREAFVERTRRQAISPDFVLVTAHVDDLLVGFAFGQPVAAGRWFQGDTEPPTDILAARKFGVTELNVRRSFRRRGIGHALMDALLADRTEPYAILGSLPGTPAHQMYQRWGWRKVAHTLPDIGLPPWDTLALPLHVTT